MSMSLRASGSRTRGPFAAALVILFLGVSLQASAAQNDAAKQPDRSGMSGVVNVNTASAEELQLLPGVGKVRAQAIVDTRRERGGFKKVDDLTEVKGIGDSMLERMRPHVTLTGRTTARSTPTRGAEQAK